MARALDSVPHLDKLWVFAECVTEHMHAAMK
jgi:hypothetical protein